MNFLTQAGQIISLSDQAIGRGGEGRVLPVAGSPQIVAKLFHVPTQARWWKVALLLADPLPQTGNHPVVVWPSEVLFSNVTPQPQFAGYLMPRARAAHPIFNFYVMSIRRVKFPAFDYRYLIYCARNLAAAVALAHQHGHVLGDLNESNVLVGLNALVQLIDVDSWQVFDRQRHIVYPCGVGKGELLPPELQGQDLARTVRSTCHDNFALAVLLFKLLNEGTHPFDGVYRGNGEPPALEARIAAGTSPYLDASGYWSPKPLAVPFNSLHWRLHRLFIQAFATGHSQPQMRPTASAWQEALDQAIGDLRRCTSHPHHWCWTGHCLWCERTHLLGGLDPFPSPPQVSQVQSPAPAAPVQQPAPVHQPQAPQPLAGLLDLLDSIGEFGRFVGQKLGVPDFVAMILVFASVSVIALLIIVLLFGH